MSVKKVISEAKVNEVSKLNFADLKEQLSKVATETKEIKKKERLYIYPENFTDAMINAKEGKAFRGKHRKIVFNFANNINLFADKNRIEDLLKEVANFQEYYKNFYRLNDFTLESITQKSDEKTANIKMMFVVIKRVLAS